MYEGYLQHDAQEVLQCILGYIQEACDTIKKEQELERSDGDGAREDKVSLSSCSGTESKPSTDEDCQVSGKRKSDTEVGNAKKKPKSAKCKKSDASEDDVCRNVPLTRSKRKSSSDITVDGAQSKDGDEEGAKKMNKEEEDEEEEKDEKTNGKRKKRGKLSWLRPSGKQPSIFSKFCSVGKISSTTTKNKAEQEIRPMDEQDGESGEDLPAENKNVEKHQGMTCRRQETCTREETLRIKK